MEVESKYNLGDLVWLIYDNKAVRFKVTGVRISVEDADNYEVEYSLSDCTKRLEHQLFDTKEELIKSL